MVKFCWRKLFARETHYNDSKESSRAQHSGNLALIVDKTLPSCTEAEHVEQDSTKPRNVF